MLAPSQIESPTLPFFESQSSEPLHQTRALWRCHDCPSDCKRPTIALSWALALALACLSVGLFGLTIPTRTPVNLLSMASAPEGETTGELAMLEMAAPEAAANTASDTTESALEMILPEPTALPDLTPPPLDLPELATVLTAEDVFEVPAADPVEPLLKVDTPRRSEPDRPSTTPRSSAPSTASRSAASSSTSTSTSTSAGSGGTGGTGTSARGSSKGYFPAPPYPASARSRGMAGTVYLSITFGADGRVTSASVSRSSGYSELDRTASDWVRRNWRGPAGKAGTYRQPVQFRLR